MYIAYPLGLSDMHFDTSYTFNPICISLDQSNFIIQTEYNKKTFRILVDFVWGILNNYA